MPTTRPVRLRWFWIAVAALLVCLVPGAAFAQKTPSAGDIEQARVHYEKGLELYNEEAYDNALVEFQRAYELAPTYKILYNIARIQRHANDYAGALTNYQRYLREGGTGVPDDRRKEVEKEVELLKARVASIEIKANVDGADVFLDDAPVCAGAFATSCIGKTPLALPAIVNPGRRKITAMKTGYATASASVTVVGGDSVSVNLDLVDLSRPAEKKVPPGPRNRAIVSWVITGILAGGAAGTGILALSYSNKLSDLHNSVNPDPNAESSYSNKVKAFSITSDILTGLAVVGGIFSTYFTVKAINAGQEPQPTPQEPPHASVRFDVGPAGAMVFGRF